MSQEILSGWKDIANYLGKGVRTVQRYQRGLGLPVRRPTGKSSGLVIATKAELCAWVLASPIREGCQLSQPTPDIAGLLNEFRQNVKKLSRLRAESKGLRQELRGSVQQLQASIRLILPEQDHVPSSEPRLPAGVPTFEPAKNDLTESDLELRDLFVHDR